MAPSQLGVFARSSPDYATANLEFHFQPLSLDKWGEGLHPFARLHGERLQPAPVEPRQRASASARPRRSRRRSRRTTSRRRRTAASRSTRCASPAASSAQAPLARYRPQEHTPGAELDVATRSWSGGGRDRHHDLPPGRHGQDGRRRAIPLAVLDERLRVRGIERPARDRRLGDAAHHLRQHQLADRDDRREGRGHDPGGRGADGRDSRGGERARSVHGPILASFGHARCGRPALAPFRPTAASRRRRARRSSAACAGSSRSSVMPASPEFTLANGRRADVIALGARRRAHHRGDQVERRRFPRRPEMAGLPRISATASSSRCRTRCRSRSCRTTAGLIVADAFGAAILREAPEPPARGRPPQGRDAALRPRRGGAPARPGRPRRRPRLCGLNSTPKRGARLDGARPGEESLDWPAGRSRRPRSSRHGL